MNISWNADKYTQDFSFVHKYGNDVLELVDFEKVQTAIDLGCGNGALTERLREEGISVIGIDASDEMLKAARLNHPNIEFVLADATAFNIEDPVDLVFSNAVFHWIDGEVPTDPVRGAAKVRYRQKEQPVTLFPLPDGGARLVFDEPLRAPAPGQAAVLYRDDEVLGGGIISTPCISR